MRISKISNYNGFKTTSPKDYISDLDNDVRNLFLMSQGRIRFGDITDGYSGENISGQWQTYTTNAVANTEDTIAHTLGSVPVGYILVRADKAGVVYDSGTTWTSSNIYLKCSVASTAVKLFLLK